MEQKSFTTAVVRPPARVSLRVFFFAALLALGACENKPEASTAAPAPSEAQRFEVKGILKAINFAGREVTIEHEEIPDYMPAMTMPFSLKDLGEVHGLSAGNALQFDFHVTKDDSWIANVRKIDASDVRLPASEASKSLAAERLREGDPLPAFQLVDDQGRSISSEAFNGKPLLLTFIFTRCPVPNYCPLMGKNFAAVEKATANDAQLGDLHLLSITIDPEFDTPEVLANYANHFRGGGSDRWRFATGSRNELEQLTTRFSVPVAPENGTISHGLATVLVSGDGVIRKIWRGNAWQVGEVIEEIKRLQPRESAHSIDLRQHTPGGRS